MARVARSLGIKIDVLKLPEIASFKPPKNAPKLPANSFTSAKKIERAYLAGRGTGTPKNAAKKDAAKSLLF